MVCESGLGILDSQFYGQGLGWEGEGGGLDTLIHTNLKCKLMNFTRPMCMLKPYFKDQISDL